MSLVGTTTDQLADVASRNELDTLRALRLTHPRFATLWQINDYLFHSIQMDTSASYLKSVPPDHLSRVSEHVREVVFITPPSWAMLFETFVEIVNCGPIQARDQELWDQGIPRRYHEYSYTPEKFVSEYMGGEWPFSKLQLRESFDAYMRNAKATEALLQGSNHQIDKTWVGVLRHLGNRARKVLFYTHDCHAMPGHHFLEADMSTGSSPPHLGSHRHDVSGQDKRYACKSASAVASDALFAKAVSCISVSGLRVSDLTINLEMTCNFKWNMIPGWAGWNLESLEKLEFIPRIPSGYPQRIEDNILEVFPTPCDNQLLLQRASSAVTLLLDKSHSSLRYLVIDPDTSICWPDCEASYDMPALEYLSCKQGRTEPALLAGWLARMPRLGHFETSGHLAEGLEYTRWVDILEAIRIHPSVCEPDALGMRVIFEQIVTNDWTEYSFQGVLHRKEKDEIEEANTAIAGFDEDDFDADKAIEDYIVHGKPYRTNRALRYMLQDDYYTDESDEASTDSEDVDEELESGSE